MTESNCKNQNDTPTRCYVHGSFWFPDVNETRCELAKAVLKYGHHTDDCSVIMRWRDDDGSKCNCGFRDIVGGDDGESNS